MSRSIRRSFRWSLGAHLATVRGQEVHIDKIVLDGKRATDVFGVVLEGADVSLLGHSYLRHISDVQIKGDKMILH